MLEFFQLNEDSFLVFFIGHESCSKSCIFQASSSCCCENMSLGLFAIMHFSPLCLKGDICLCIGLSIVQPADLLACKGEKFAFSYHKQMFASEIFLGGGLKCT